MSQIYETYTERIYLLQRIQPVDDIYHAKDGQSNFDYSQGALLTTSGQYAKLEHPKDVSKQPGQSIASRRNIRHLRIRASSLSKDRDERADVVARPRYIARLNTEPINPHPAREGLDHTSLQKSVSEGADEVSTGSYKYSDTTYRRPSLNMQDLVSARSNQPPSLHHRASDRTLRHRISPLKPRELVEVDLTPPTEQVLRPYWLMNVLLPTLNGSGDGVYLTKSLYVSSDIWHTKNVKIKAEDEKIKAYGTLIQALKGVTSLTGLIEFEKAMDVAHAILARKLGSEVMAASGLSTRDPKARLSSKSISRLLSRSTSDETQGHRQLQGTMATLFSEVQCLARLQIDTLSVKEQLKVDQIYEHARYFFKVVVRLYLADLSCLINAKMTLDGS